MKLFTDADTVGDSNTSEKSKERNKENETGWDRLYLMYSRDQFGNLSPELVSVLQTTYTGVFVGFCYGGITNSRIAYMNFMQRNDATAFQSHLDAKRRLQDAVTIGFAKGAFKWGWRLAFFTCSYMLLTTTVAVYRGHSGLLEYVVAGAVTGATYKCGLGVRGAVVGGGLGGVLGCMAGLASLGILKMSGMTMEEVRYWQFQWQQDREKLFHRGEKKDIDPLFEHHKQIVGSSTNPLEVMESVPPQTEKPVK